MKTASKILMVRPGGFGFNPDTAQSNAFQKVPSIDPNELSKRAIAEFDGMVSKLRKHDIEVLVLDETKESVNNPDCVFPNNVFSTHPDGTFVWYPMEAPARRRERRFISRFFNPKKVIDLTDAEVQGKFLEGTGSLILDHDQKLAFVCLSSRSDPDLIEHWSGEMGFKPIVFRAKDRHGLDIYHTNVMMCLGDGFAVINMDSITDLSERASVERCLTEGGRKIVTISHQQMESFAGNMIEVMNTREKKYLLMSKSAFDVLSTDQKARLEQFTSLLHFDVPLIEEAGGGSVRCMVAELFDS